MFVERLKVALDAALDVVLPVLCEEERSARLRQLVRTEDRFEVAGFALFDAEEFVVLQLLVVDLLLNVEQRLLVYGGRLKGFRHVAEYLHCPGFNRPDNASLCKALSDVRNGAHRVHQPLGLFGHILATCGFEECGEFRCDFPDLIGGFGGGCPQSFQTHLEGLKVFALLGLLEYVVNRVCKFAERVSVLRRVLQPLELLGDVL